MPKLSNELYDCVLPLRLTELQERDLEKYAKDESLTMNQVIRLALVHYGVTVDGPEPKARKGCGKKDQAA